MEAETPQAEQPSWKDRFLRRLAEILCLFLYQSVQIYQDPEAREDRPWLAVANHFGGFSDPLLLLYAMQRRPRFLARDVIWRVPVVRNVMNFVGAIPVHRRQDGPAGQNVDMFASCHEALADGDVVCIFPEGISHDEPRIEPIKTGAARIALGAMREGTTGIQIVPSGVHYDDKAVLRSRAYVDIGQPIDLDSELGSIIGPDRDPDPTDHDAVRRLTDAIELHLRRASPEFDSWQQQRDLSQAAEIAIRRATGDSDPVTYAERESLANRLARSPDADQADIVEAVHTYRADLEALGVDDEQFARRSERGFLGLFFRAVLIGLVLFPFAVMGALINAIPALLVRAVGRVKMAGATMATVKPMVAIVVFGVTWCVCAWIGARLFGSAWMFPAVLLLMPVYLAAVVLFLEQMLRVGRAFGGLSARTPNTVEEEMEQHRATVEHTVAGAVRATADSH